jgi:large subunit ribosomal protein L24
MQATRPLKKPTKQRKMLYEASAHLRHKRLAAHLSPELRSSHRTKSFPVRSGDTVQVVRGDHKGVEGKITRVDLSKYRIYVEGLTREKVDGTTINVAIHPSKVIVTRLNLDDKWRKEILDSRKEALKRLEKAEKAEKKPKITLEEKPVEVEEVKPEEAKEVVEEKPAAKVKAPKKIVARAKRKTAKKKGEEETKTETEEAKGEQVKKTKPARKTKRTPRKIAKKSEEGKE